MEIPLVSIIMPVHNSEEYIAQAISSVLEQSYRNWELIIIDDCSGDNSTEIIQSYADSDQRIKLCFNDTNLGVARSRNKGIDLAQGDWIAFLDSDDIWRREKLEKQLTLAEEKRADLIYSSYSLFLNDSDSDKRKDYLVPSTVTYRSMLKENGIGCSTAMIRKEALAGHRFSVAAYHEDYALWLELLRSGISSAGCREILADWRMTPHSRSADKVFAAKKRWLIFRNIEKLPLHTALYCFTAYAVHGLKKRYTGYMHITGRRMNSE